jgi:NET1-associated nuclear protein 1 (U3 small nucleolar RNA-associated protein 17)
VDSCNALTLHWHADRVNAMSLTGNGEYLLSGGQESTLVIWQMSSMQKRFIPRLSGQVLEISIAPNQLHYGLLLSNNSILIVDAVDHSTRVINGLECSGLNLSLYPVEIGIQIDPKTMNFVVNGMPSTLQLFNSDLEPISRINIATRNVIHTHGRTLDQQHVKKTCFTFDGAFMVTVDELGKHDERFLKFWGHDEERARYELNTRIDQPHSAPVTSMVASPTEHLVVTSSFDSTVRLWRFKESMLFFTRLLDL